jgi:tetratricopeptide (TPR) repeat protein
MTHDKEILLQQIKTYFLVAYSHQLADEEASSLANILFSGGVTPELVSFAVSDRGGPHPNPDDNFIPEKIFQLWHVLHPITVSSKGNHLLNVFCKCILYSYLLNINENNALILSTVFQKKSKANLGYTRFLYSSFLGHSEFEMARSYNETDPQLADRYYRSCIEHLMIARELSRKEDRFNYGMVGVSHYFIAQSLSGAERQSHLFASIENLGSAERLGDKTTEHFKYLGDALLEHAVESNDLSVYLRALDKLKQAYSQDPHDTNIIASLARCHLNVGISKLRNRQDSGTDHLEEAIRRYDLLLETFKGKKRYPDTAIQGRRGQAYLQLWYAKRDPKLLDRAIVDFQATRTEDPPFLWQHPLANALLERYHLFEDISDFQEAKKLNDQNHSADNRNESHLKQRGRIYLTGARNFADKEAYDIALKSFRICLPSEDPEIQSYIGLLLASRGMQFGYENDLREAIKWLETKPDLSDREETKIGILPKVYRVLAMKIHQKQLEEALSLLDKAIAILQEKLSGSEPSSNQELAEYHDLIGSTYHDRYKLSILPEDIYYAIEHLQRAYNLGMADTMFFGRLGRVCLQRGVITDEPENQSGFFEDAIKYLEVSRSGGNEDASNYSELGEAYLRLYRIRKDRRILKKALDMFLESLNRGNDTVENLGLIGDCYYHLSYFEISEANLFKALEFKAKAREAGHESKEHFSVVGRINLSLFEKLGNQDYFITGIKFICEAGLKDKTWPWPVCQLAEVAEQSPDLIQQLKSKGQIGKSFSYPDEGIWRFFLDNQPEELWFEAAKLAANWPEVKEKILGGKSKVYIVEDPHGLISTTYVFKPGDNPKKPLPDRGLLRLREEQERTLKMNQYLVQIGAEKFLVPTPIRIFSMDEAKIYVMRRATGQNLSNLILYGPDRYCEEAIRNTIEFLALYHAWHPVPQENKEQVVEESRNRLNNLKQVIEAVGLPIGDKIINVTEPIFEIMKQLPLVEKRDAHPDNWIVTNEGKIVMIDLEKPEPLSQFILSELVQVIEDLPYLPWDREGWQRRKALIKNYLEYYNRFLELKSIPQVSISSEQQVAGYLSFTTWRALCGIGFAFGEEHREGISSSTKLRWKDQMEHYFNLVSVVPAIWSEENISFAALNWEPLLTSVEEIRKAVYSLKRDD